MERAYWDDTTPETEAEVMRAAVYLSLRLEDRQKIFFTLYLKRRKRIWSAWYFLTQRLFSAGFYGRAEQAARNALAASVVIKAGVMTRSFLISWSVVSVSKIGSKKR